MYRAIAPWATENPVLMHVRSARPDAVKLAIDDLLIRGEFSQVGRLRFVSTGNGHCSAVHFKREEAICFLATAGVFEAENPVGNQPA